MIELNHNLRPSADLHQKAKACFIRKKSETQYIVTPKRYSKSRRLVTFIPGSPVRALCEDLHALEQCPANRFDSLCYHVLAAIKRLDRNIRRESKRAA